MTKPRRDPGYKRLSDAELNARALETRTSTYADPHAKSWALRMDRASHEPRTLREYVHVLTKAYRDEVPGRIHSRDLDSGGAPEWTPQFADYLTASDRATDTEDNYRTPFRSALDYLLTHPAETMRRDGEIVRRVVIGGVSAEEAAVQWAPYERRVAHGALRTMWRSMSDVRIVTRRSDKAA